MKNRKWENDSHKGVLYLCATPIGNLEDITFRVLRILKEVDIIAVESIKRTLKLINHFEINTRMVSYREDNRDSQGEYIVGLLESGKNIALVSDAGMPGLSDPGNHLIRLCYEQNIKVTCVPGPSSILTSLVLSGFSPNRFVFEGFLPRKKLKRTSIIKQIAMEERPVIIFEAPHRLLKLIKELDEEIGERNICITRELTKIYEEVKWGRPSELIDYLSKEEIKGEIILIIDSLKISGMENTGGLENRSVEEHMRELIDQGKKLKDAAREVSRLCSIPIKEAYKKGLEIREKK